MGITNDFNDLEKEITKAIDKFSSEMLNMAIRRINEAVAQEQLKTDYWRNKARILASKFRQCLTHGSQSVEELDERIDKMIVCHDCEADKL